MTDAPTVTQERIDAAAIRYDGVVYAVPQPGRHHDVIHKMAKAGFGPECMHEQGFVTNKGRFVGRWDALRLAVLSGQLDERKKKTAPANELFSEDLW